MEFLDCGITALGCEFLGRILGGTILHPMKVLKLDLNLIGDKGARKLADALNMNSTLEILSLNYCGITTEGSHAVLEIIIYGKSELKEMYLKGNPFKDQGVNEILHSVKINTTLEKLDLSDT